MTETDDRAGIAAVVGEYLANLADGDFEHACALFTGRLGREFVEVARADLGSDENGPQLLGRIVGALDDTARERLRRGEVLDVAIDGDLAAARVHGASVPIPLRRVEGRWLIAGMPYPSASGLESLGQAAPRQSLGEAAAGWVDIFDGLLLGGRQAGLGRFARWIHSPGTVPSEDHPATRDAERPVRRLVVAISAQGETARAGVESDGRSVVVVAGDALPGLGSPAQVDAIVEALVSQIGFADPLESVDLGIAPDVLVALWALADAGLAPDAPLAWSRAAEILEGVLDDPPVGGVAVVGLVERGILERRGEEVHLGGEIIPWEDALRVEEHLEIVSDDPGDPLAGGPDRVLFVGPPGGRIAVLPPAAGDPGGVRLHRGDHGELEALVRRMLGTPSWPSVAEAFAPSAARWRSDVAGLDVLLTAGWGAEELPEEDIPPPAVAAPLVVTAEISVPGSDESRAWQVWPDLALELSDDTAASLPRIFSPDDLVLRVSSFCGPAGERPSTGEPVGDATRIGRIVCLHGVGETLEGGSITWLLDGAGACWLLDADGSGDEQPAPVPASARDLGRLLLEYLPSGVEGQEDA